MDDHHSAIERNVTRLDSEVVMIKSTLTNVSSELHSLKGDMTRGFEAQARSMEKQGLALTAALKEQANAKPRFGLENIMALLGIGSMFCAVFWMIISQRIDPLKDAMVEGLKRVDHESALRDMVQQGHIDSIKADVKRLEDRQLQILIDAAYERAKQDSLQRICDENHEAIRKLNTRP